MINRSHKYDDASWHHNICDCDNSGGTCLCGCVHIAMFVTWCAIHGFVSGEYFCERQEIEVLHKRHMTPAQWFEQYCDGKFISDMLNDQGNAFAFHSYENRIYFEFDVPFFSDDETNPAKCHDTWNVFDQVDSLLTTCFEKWNRTRLK